MQISLIFLARRKPTERVAGEHRTVVMRARSAGGAEAMRAADEAGRAPARAAPGPTQRREVFGADLLDRQADRLERDKTLRPRQTSSSRKQAAGAAPGTARFPGSHDRPNRRCAARRRRSQRSAVGSQPTAPRQRTNRSDQPLDRDARCSRLPPRLAASAPQRRLNHAKRRGQAQPAGNRRARNRLGRERAFCGLSPDDMAELEWKMPEAQVLVVFRSTAHGCKVNARQGLSPGHRFDERNTLDAVRYVSSAAIDQGR